MTDASSVGLLATFGAGVVSFLSPGVLPLVPAYMSYIAGHSAQRERRSRRGQWLVMLGTGVPFLLTAVFIDRAARLLGRLRGFGAALQWGGGLVLVVFGAAMITGDVSRLSTWLLLNVPALGTIG